MSDSLAAPLDRLRDIFASGLQSLSSAELRRDRLADLAAIADALALANERVMRQDQMLRYIAYVLAGDEARDPQHAADEIARALAELEAHIATLAKALAEAQVSATYQLADARRQAVEDCAKAMCIGCGACHHDLRAQLAAATARIEAMTTNAEALEARAAEHEQTRADLAAAQEAREMAERNLAAVESLNHVALNAHDEWRERAEQAERDKVELLGVEKKLLDEVEQAEAHVKKLRAALADLLQQARPVYLESRMMLVDVTLTPEAYAALRALLAEPGA